MLEFSAIFAVAAIAGVFLTPAVIRMAATWGFYDTPRGDRRVHTEPLPRIGGVAVFLSMSAGLLVLGLISLTGLLGPAGSPAFLFGVVFGGAIVFATGLIDDIRGLRPMGKLSAQVVAALVVFSYGFRVDSLSLGAAELPLGLLALPLTVLWVVGVTNAFNLIDGLDGLATGIAMVALAATLLVAVVLGNPEVVLLCAALLGALAAFFRFNFSPARIFLGDSGSLFIGFMLAVLTVHGAQTAAGSVLFLVPLFALAIPLLDTVLAILRRWLRVVPLSEADGRHIHHRLLALGLTHRSAVVVLYVASATLAVLGLALVFAPPPAVVSIAAAGGGAVLLALLYGLRRLQYHEFVEAGAVLVSAVRRARVVIRNQIYARDLAHIIEHADSMEQVAAVLEDNAHTFDFLHMEVCGELDAGTQPLVLFNGRAARAWKLDYPVTPHSFVDGDDYVLRIWCNPQNGAFVYGAERVARVLAPAIEGWILEAHPERGERRARSHAGSAVTAEEPVPVRSIPSLGVTVR